jgi:hypothetical protein
MLERYSTSPSRYATYVVWGAVCAVTRRDSAPRRSRWTANGPGPDVRERPLLGVSMRTTGFKQGNRKLKNPQSTHRGRTAIEIQRRKADIARDRSARPVPLPRPQ